VERRRLDPNETSGHTVEGDAPRVFAGPPRQKQAANLELHAAEAVAAALLQRKAGPKVIVPEWLLSGFGRATTWRLAPRDPGATAARREALLLVLNKKRTAQQVWGGELEFDEAVVLRPSLADLLAYGPGMTRFPQFIAGFRPEEEEQRSTEQALQSAGIKLENLETVWPEFVRTLR
jgi:hypothetical protein